MVWTNNYNNNLHFDTPTKLMKKCKMREWVKKTGAWLLLAMSLLVCVAIWIGAILFYTSLFTGCFPPQEPKPPKPAIKYHWDFSKHPMPLQREWMKREKLGLNPLKNMLNR